MTNASLPTVIVTGAAGGIGLEVVRLLRQKARVLALVLDADQVAAATEAGATACFICDVSDADATAAALMDLRAATAESGLRAVILCAAIQTVGAVEAMPRQQLEKLFSVNLFGAWQLVQGLLPSLRQTQGRVVLFSSMAGRVAAPLLGAYTASKFALEGMADTLRRELVGSGVSISLIEPGGVATPMAASQGAQVEQAVNTLNPALRQQYEGLYRGYLHMATRALKHASTPEAVAAVAVKAAIGRPAPAPRILVGADAKALVTLSRLLPSRSLDRLMAKLSKAPPG